MIYIRPQTTFSRVQTTSICLFVLLLLLLLLLLFPFAFNQVTFVFLNYRIKHEVFLYVLRVILSTLQPNRYTLRQTPHAYKGSCLPHTDER